MMLGSRENTYDKRALEALFNEDLVFLRERHLQRDERRPKDGKGADNAQDVILVESAWW